jgi:preprotein translocase subunit SecE
LAEKAKSRKVNPVVGYFRESAAELRKVNWPTRREAIQLTWLVIVVMIVVGLILFTADLSASGLLSLLLNL